MPIITESVTLLNDVNLELEKFHLNLDFINLLNEHFLTILILGLILFLCKDIIFIVILFIIKFGLFLGSGIFLYYITMKLI